MTNTVIQAKEGAPRAKEQTPDHDATLRELEIAAKRLELLEREANLEDIKERLAERELRRDQTRMKARTNGQTIAQINRDKKIVQERCTHRKGGEGAHGVIGGQGMSEYYAIFKHTMANGDMWITCLRCGKRWKPPVRSAYTTQAQFDAALAEYELAKRFLTTNKPSGSSMFKWSDDGDYYRQLTANS